MPRHIAVNYSNYLKIIINETENEEKFKRSVFFRQG